MDSKFYVSLEAAMLLKWKGYDKPTDYIYVIDGQFYSIWRNKDGNMESNYYHAPTKAEAIDWLESKGIMVELRTMYCESKQENGWHWFYAICEGDCIEKINECNDYIKLFPTRLEAEEAAIIKACELLKGKEE